MSKVRFISGFTEGTIYESIIQEGLIPSFKRWGLPFHIYPYKDSGDWATNSRYRPNLIKTAMETFKGENIVWIDADAEIVQFPELLFHIPENIHVAVHYLVWSNHYGRVGDADKVEILDGTSFYRNVDDGLKPFVDEWCDIVNTEKLNHRRVLGAMIDEQIDDNLNVFILPRSYCYIDKKPDGKPPAIPIKDPIIVHHQASRLARINLYGTRKK